MKHFQTAIKLAIFGGLILFGSIVSQAKPFTEDCKNNGMFTIEPDGFAAKHLTKKCGTTDTKISQLCKDFPDKDCMAIDNYCRESLDKGFDCHL